MSVKTTDIEAGAIIPFAKGDEMGLSVGEYTPTSECHKYELFHINRGELKKRIRQCFVLSID